MLIRRSQKKRYAEPRQKQNHRSVVIDPMVNPGSSAHRHQARSRADPTRTHHRMVTMAQSSPGDRSACAPQSQTTTVMLSRLTGQRGPGTSRQATGLEYRPSPARTALSQSGVDGAGGGSPSASPESYQDGSDRVEIFGRSTSTLNWNRKR